MVLRERLGESETIYQDTQELNQTEWAKMLGSSENGLRSAELRGGANFRRVYRSGTHESRVLTPVGDFPKIVQGLSSAKPRKDRYQWPQGIDTSHDFQITAKSGAVLIYEYPHFNEYPNSSNRILRVLKSLISKGLRIIDKPQ